MVVATDRTPRLIVNAAMAVERAAKAAGNAEQANRIWRKTQDQQNRAAFIARAERISVMPETEKMRAKRIAVMSTAFGR